MALLTRTQFSARCLERDGHRCVLCGSEDGVHVHHVLERRLWGDGGYYLDNGASVCEPCHLRCEQTLVSCDEVRAAAGIERVALPEHLYPDEVYDKWGDVVLPNGTRLRGELFDDESVQRVLAPVLHLFTDMVKYPRTFHLPWSPGISDDDRVVGDVGVMFGGREVVVTAKMDGENTTLYRDGLHARSLDYQPHPSRDRVRAMHASIAHDIPDGWRVCLENLYAVHSIHYRHLRSWFQVFSVWDDRNTCLPWDETTEWAALFGLPPVPVLYRGTWDEALVRDLYEPELDGDPCEGYVVRLADGFRFRDFRQSVAKYVRAGHVSQHGGHWARRKVVPNGTRNS